MSLLGGIIGKATRPIVDGVRDVAVERERTKQVASATWRPWLARSIGWLLILYVLGTFAMIAVTMFGIVRSLLWVGGMSLADLWDQLVLLGSDLFWFSGLFLTTYTGSRGLEKISGSIRGRTGRVLGSVAKAVTGNREPEQREVIREDLDVSPDEIERIPGIRVAETSRPLNATQLKRIAREIKEDEGYRTKIYRDTLGNLTVGIGHLILPGDPEHGKAAGFEISRERVLELFNQDIGIAIRAAESVVHDFDSLPVEARAVLINMAFQLGHAGLSRFELMLEAIQDGDWHAAADEALDSRWAVQTPQRAQRMAARLKALAR